MRTSRVVGYALIASASITSLVACSGASSLMSPPPVGVAHADRTTVSQRLAPHSLNTMLTVKPLIFYSGESSNNNVVDIYQQARPHKMVGQITGLNQPRGLATDVAGNLYVANGASNVPVFAPPYTGSPALTLDNTGYIPQTLAVSSGGVVAVGDFCASSCTTEYTVLFFAKDATKPCAKVATPPYHDVIDALDFDRQGNLFIAGEMASTFDGFLGEIKGGCKAKRMTPLTTVNKIRPYFVHVDKANDVAVLDYYTTADIYTYHHPNRGSLGTPISTTHLAAPAFNFSFLASGADLWTLGEGVSDEFDYPAGGNPEDSINTSHAGIAVTPPLVP